MSRWQPPAAKGTPTAVSPLTVTGPSRRDGGRIHFDPSDDDRPYQVASYDEIQMLGGYGARIERELWYSLRREG
ncbi:MAG: hypothetical protein KY442_04375 [Proteobacteria bacterium]|nr:hypothetical protein [Pseudomonadota bacterium]